MTSCINARAESDLKGQEHGWLLQQAGDGRTDISVGLGAFGGLGGEGSQGVNLGRTGGRPLEDGPQVQQVGVALVDRLLAALAEAGRQRVVRESACSNESQVCLMLGPTWEGRGSSNVSSVGMGGTQALRGGALPPRGCWLGSGHWLYSARGCWDGTERACVQVAQVVGHGLLVDDEVSELHHMAALVVGEVVAGALPDQLVLLLQGLDGQVLVVAAQHLSLSGLQAPLWH